MANVSKERAVEPLTKGRNIILRVGSRTLECGIEGYSKPLFGCNIHHFSERQNWEINIADSFCSGFEYITSMNKGSIDALIDDIKCFNFINHDLLAYEETTVFKNDLLVHLTKNLRKLFYKFGVNTISSKLLLIVNENTPSYFIDDILRVILVDRLLMRSLVICRTSLMSCISAGSDSALVIDIGWKDTRIIPVFDFAPLERFLKITNRAGCRLHYTILDEISKSQAENIYNLTFKQIENLVVKLDSLEKVDANIAGSSVPKSLIISCLKQVFIDDSKQNETNELSIIRIVINLIVKELPIDLRKKLASRIIITGGVSNIPGFKDLLIGSIQKGISEYERVAFEPKCIKSLGAWVGTSIYSMQILKKQKKKNQNVHEIRRE